MADAKNPLGGPKSADEKRDTAVDSTQNQAGADMHIEEARGKVSGDTTSSTGGANNPGQHGRDGGEIDGTSNNPVPSDAVAKGEPVDPDAEDEKAEDKGIKKL